MTPTAPRPVLIFGAHIAALGVLRVLARRGIPAFVVDDTANIITRSRWYRPAERTLPETSDPAVLAGYLELLDLPEAVLIPCSDRWALAVAGLPAELRERFPASIAPHDAVASFVDKDRFQALLARLDLPRPRSIPIARPADLGVRDGRGSGQRVPQADRIPNGTTSCSRARAPSSARATRRSAWSRRRPLPASRSCCRNGSPGTCPGRS